jgi:hypothetical protein
VVDKSQPILARRKQILGESEWQGSGEAAPGPVSMISTAELTQRPSRLPDYAVENRALISLAQEMATAPYNILQKLAETALTLCRAHSAGFSLLEDADQNKRFHWRALVGQWAPHVDGERRATLARAARFSTATLRCCVHIPNAISLNLLMPRFLFALDLRRLGVPPPVLTDAKSRRRCRGTFEGKPCRQPPSHPLE